jgi:glutathione reductase (NADPH)
MSDFDYDLFVIGGGSGGVRAARVASATGATVGLAEEFRMGGTCVIRGCVPKKLMVFASEFQEMYTNARAYGWDVQDGTFNWPSFRTNLANELDRLETVYRKMLAKSDVTVHDARATVTGTHEVTLSDGAKFSAKHILVATGGRPVLPDIKNAELGITSNDIFTLPELPKNILIVGGGYIASEFACILNGLNVEVTQFYRGEQILRGFDNEARGLVSEMMIEKGVNLQLGVNVLEMEKYDDGICVKCTNGSEKIYDQVIFATGRTPNTDGLGLEAVGVEVGLSNEVMVDDYSQTKVPSIYAIGDVTNRVQLTPVAIREGMAFVETVFKGNPTKIDHTLIPSAIFTQPEMGTVGLSEEEACKQETIEVYATTFRPLKTAFASRPDRVLMKLVVSQTTRKVLGCHIVSPNAGEMIQLVGIAIKMGATKEQFDATCAVHPTISEELVTMRDPVRTVKM